MPGETDLRKLIKSMRPVLHEGDYIFATVQSLEGLELSGIIFFFREAEAITLVVSKKYADAKGLAYEFIFSWITLSVYSSLEAVGLTAAFSAELTRAGISCNIVAGYNHDHLFVSSKDAAKAMEVLRGMSQG